jgi:hypothetical protein
MRTFEQWKEFYQGVQAKDFVTWKGTTEELITHLAELGVSMDVELEAEAQRLDALSPEERTEDFFREQFGRLRERGLRTEHDQGYYAAMLTCAVCLAGINSDYPIVEEEKQNVEATA